MEQMYEQKSELLLWKTKNKLNYFYLNLVYSFISNPLEKVHSSCGYENL